MPFALILPPLLVRTMSPAEFSAWTLILGTSAYVNLLNLGLQTAIGKFIAGYDSTDDRRSSSRILSTSFVILCACAVAGAMIIAIITWRVPELFGQMPPDLVGSVREGILFVGLSMAFALPFSAFLAAFTGLQQYRFPTILTIFSKSLSSAALIVLVLMHGVLEQMVWLIAGFNLATALGQYIGWRKYIRMRVDFSFSLVDWESVRQLAKYGGVLSIWTVAMLLISGLDVVIVGHYDYQNTGYYGNAATVTNYMLLVISSLFGPLIPAVSYLQGGKTPAEIGNMVVKATRYCSIMLCLIGLPLFFGAYQILALWVGHDYALRSAPLLQVLILGNVIRQLGYPYALVVLATGVQHLATLSAVAEGIINVVVSIYLVQKIGAIGVAIGTLVGAFIGVGVHFGVSMTLTKSTALISRRRLICSGILRALSCLIPSILFFPFWITSPTNTTSLPWIAVLTVTTLAITWRNGLLPDERRDFKAAATRCLSRTFARS
jgi:O-antigen/teichoic acid export membrane protein